MKLITFISIFAVSTLMLLATTPVNSLPYPKLEGLGDKNELEKAIVQAIMSVQGANSDKRHGNSLAQSKYREVMMQQIAHQRRGQASVNQIGNKATAQYSGVTIENCGTVGTIIQSALTFGLGFIPGGQDAYGVYVRCPTTSYPCTVVTVEVPANDVKADIDVCEENGQACVEVYAGSCAPGFFAIPIPIAVPLPNGQQVTVTIKIDAFSGCASAEVNAPACTNN